MCCTTHETLGTERTAVPAEIEHIKKANVQRVDIVCAPQRCSERSDTSYQNRDQAGKSKATSHCDFCKSRAKRLAKRLAKRPLRCTKSSDYTQQMRAPKGVPVPKRIVTLINRRSNSDHYCSYYSLVVFDTYLNHLALCKLCSMQVAVGARLMLRHNTCTEDGLVNGAIYGSNCWV